MDKVIVNPDVKLAFETLKKKRPIYNELYAYYNGDQPVRYATTKLEEIFGKFARFTESWCGLVVDSVVERVTLRQFMVANDLGMSEKLNELVEESGLNEDYDDIMRSVLITAEAFVVLGKEGEASSGPPIALASTGSASAGGVEAYYNDPRQVMVYYDPERPRRMKFAGKIWQGDGEDGVKGEATHLLLYYRDRFEHYQAKGDKWPEETNSFKKIDEDDERNLLGEIPVVHFRLSKSELTSLIPVQDAVNKLNADMMIASEFGGLPQRYVITNADIKALKNKANEIWELPENSQAGQFAAAALEGYISAIDHKINAFSAISRTPKHFFFASTSNISGDALVALEAPLVKKCGTYIDGFRPKWRSLGGFLLRLRGETNFKERAIQPVFNAVETTQPSVDADTLVQTVAAGIPLITALRKRGWTEAEIDGLVEDMKRMEEIRKKTLGKALVDAQKEFDQNQT